MAKLLEIATNVLHRVLPFNDTSDFLFNYVRFVKDHGRLPRRRKIFNDYLYNIKNGHEILNPLRQFVSDKYLLKTYVKAKVGDKYNVPTVAVFRKFEDLKRFEIPENCCIKPTNASQAFILRKNNEPIDIAQAEEWFNINYYRLTRERNYKYLKPMVIIEPLLFNSKDLMDYRFFCYKGRVKLICVDIGKSTEYRRVFYNHEWVKQDFSLGYEIYKGNVEQPKNLDEMIKVAEELSSDFSFVRVDLYSNGNECLVGEITNCHSSASQSFVPLDSEEYASKIIFEE